MLKAPGPLRHEINSSGNDNDQRSETALVSAQPAVPGAAEPKMTDDLLIWTAYLILLSGGG